MEYQAEKKARAETNLKNIVSQKYHNFFNVFLKKNLDTFPPYQKYDHKIHLKKEEKLGHASLYKMFPEELDTIKRYLNFHFVKKFIQASLASYYLLVLFIKKPGGEV